MTTSEEKYQSVVDRLEQRDQQRREAIKRNAREFTDYKQVLLEKKMEVIKSLEAIDKKKMSQEEIKTLIGEKNQLVNQLANEFNMQSEKMSAYDTEKVIKEIQSLKETISSFQDKLFPKKRFAFSKTKKTEKPREAEPNAGDTIPNQENQNSSAGNASIMDDLMILGVGEDCYLKGHIGAKDLRLSPAQENSTLLIEELNDCRVVIDYIPGNVYVKHIQASTIIFTRPIAGSLWLEDAHNSKLSIICRQLRIHDTEDCQISLFVSSFPIIENSTRLLISEITIPSDEGDSARYASATKDFEKANFPPLLSAVNKWQEVNDFQEPTSRESGTSTNWALDKEKKICYFELLQ